MFYSSLPVLLASISLVSLVTGQKVHIISPQPGCNVVPGTSLNVTLEIQGEMDHQVALGFGLNSKPTDVKALGNLLLGTLDTTKTPFDPSTKQLSYSVAIPAAENFTEGVNVSYSFVVSQYYFCGNTHTPECNIVSVPVNVSATPGAPSPSSPGSSPGDSTPAPASPSGQPASSTPDQPAFPIDQSAQGSSGAPPADGLGSGDAVPVSPSGKPSKTPALQAEQPTGSTPDQPASTPDQPAVTPGSTPDQPGSPDQPASTPGQPASTPSSTPDQPAATPGSTPGQPASTPDAPTEQSAQGGSPIPITDNSTTPDASPNSTAPGVSPCSGSSSNGSYPSSDSNMTAPMPAGCPPDVASPGSAVPVPSGPSDNDTMPDANSTVPDVSPCAGSSSNASYPSSDPSMNSSAGMPAGCPPDVESPGASNSTNATMPSGPSDTGATPDANSTSPCSGSSSNGSYPSSGSDSANGTTDSSTDMSAGCPPVVPGSAGTKNSTNSTGNIFTPPGGEGNSTDNSAAGSFGVSTQSVALSVAVVLGCLSSLP